jgi:hypothetical protein
MLQTLLLPLRAADRRMSSDRIIQENRDNDLFISNGMRACEFHYRLRLLQAGGLLLKDSGEFQQKR